MTGRALPAMRPSLDDVLIASAYLWASRSTCSRLHVGAVVADSTGRILMTGYNGTPPGQLHCVHEDDQPCTDAIHAEANVILWAARQGVSVCDQTLYTTHSPCLACAKMIVVSGVRRVVYAREYRSSEGLDYLKRMIGRVDCVG